jgi:sec-independent protein translocase protein TatA
MFNQVGPLEVLLLVGIALIIFGPKRLPELGRSAGRGIREFRRTLGGDDNDDVDEHKRELEQSPPSPPTPTVTEPVEGEVVSDRKA